MFDVVRLIAGGLLALICSYAGVLIRERYSVREKFYRDLDEFCVALSGDIGYTKKPLPAVVTDFCYGRKGACAKLLQDYVSSLKTSATFDGGKTSDAAHLNAQEQNEVASFLQGLGKTAMHEQLAFISKSEKAFAVKYEKCREDTKRLGGMYFKLLVLLGLAILVLVA